KFDAICRRAVHQGLTVASHGPSGLRRPIPLSGRGRGPSLGGAAHDPKFAAVALVALFASASLPAEACTGISLKAKDGAAIRGRTLEFGFPMQSNVIVIPAGKEMSGTLPDDGKGLSYTSRYAVVGANALNLPVILDGINDQGFSVGLFYFPNYAKYTDV